MKYISLFLLLVLGSCDNGYNSVQFISESRTAVDSVSIDYSPECPSLMFTDIAEGKKNMVTPYPNGRNSLSRPCIIKVFRSGKAVVTKSFGSFSGTKGLAKNYTITLTGNDKLTISNDYIRNLGTELLIWQGVGIAILAIIIYAIIRLYRKTIKFLDKNS